LGNSLYRFCGTNVVVIFPRRRMKQPCRVAISVLAMMLLFPHWAISEEKDVLQALEGVKLGIEEGVSCRELAGLLAEADVQIRILRRGETSDCFRLAAHRSYYWYDLGRKSWETLMRNQQQRDKYARQAQHGEHHLKTIAVTIAGNYDKLVRHAQDALPTKWEYGNAALQRARDCLER
jgi:hypothetical protein